MEAKDVKYRPAMFPNGSVNLPAVGVAVVPRYRECRKNHAAFMGGHAVDGCGEFMPSLDFSPADPSSFNCAACGCHRNFHRRMLVKESSPSPPPQQQQPQVALLAAPPMAATVLHGLPQRGEETPEVRLPAADGDDSESDSDDSEYDDERSGSPPQQPPPAHVPAPVAQQPPAYFASPPPPHMMLSLNSNAQPGAAAAAQSQQRLPVQVSPATAPPAHAHAGGVPARKRFRTKFTPEQKQRMQELSERLGWRLQKRDEAIVNEWCGDIGVSKGVFKVWMHNNKHNYLGGHSARRSAASSVATTPTAPAAAGPFHIAPAPGAPPPPAPFVPSVTHSSPAPTATGFNINGTAATATPAFTAVHQVNGTSSPQSA